MINQESNFAELVFSSKKVQCFFNSNLSVLKNKVENTDIIFITDENIFNLHPEKFKGEKVIVIKAGENNKNQQTVDNIIGQLIELQADRKTFIVGVGGGVVTDIAGYAASVYMRGIRFALAPTSILAMVDAAVGGKNGVDVGIYKNLVGTITHPDYLIYDFSFLTTLPEEEWISGFAEILKHACIKDIEMFEYLEQKTLSDFRDHPDAIAELVEKNVRIKYGVVSGDERETGERKFLNFGHTVGHAIEKISGLLHGNAVSIGMVAACIISEKINVFSEFETTRVIHLLERYGLPVSLKFDREKACKILMHDKKRSGDDMNFVVLNKIGEAAIKKIPLTDLQKMIVEFPAA